MKVVLYAQSMKGAGGELCRAIEESVVGKNHEVCKTTESLSQRLLHPNGDLTVAVLLAGNREELDELVSICESLYDIRVILILPDRDEDTISQGHKLFPRFITYVDADLEMVGVVLSKMLIESMPREGRTAG